MEAAAVQPRLPPLPTLGTLRASQHHDLGQDASSVLSLHEEHARSSTSGVWASLAASATGPNSPGAAPVPCPPLPTPPSRRPLETNLVTPNARHK